MTNFDKIHTKCNFVDETIAKGRRESVLFSFSLSVPPGIKFFKEPTSIFFKIMNKGKISDKTINLKMTMEKNCFDGESSKFTVMFLTNIKLFSS